MSYVHVPTRYPIGVPSLAIAKWYRLDHGITTWKRTESEELSHILHMTLIISVPHHVVVYYVSQYSRILSANKDEGDDKRLPPTFRLNHFRSLISGLLYYTGIFEGYSVISWNLYRLLPYIGYFVPIAVGHRSWADARTSISCPSRRSNCSQFRKPVHQLP
jgi:hypothetical protein